MLHSTARFILTVLSVLLLLTACAAWLLASPHAVPESDICRICYTYGGGDEPCISRTWDLDTETLTVTRTGGKPAENTSPDVYTLTEEQTDEIVEAFNKYGVFTWQPVYGTADADGSGVTLTVTYRSGESRTTEIGSQQPPHFADVMEVLLRNSTASNT